jgi:tetratricopeptide (TPR) repeat protein
MNAMRIINDETARICRRTLLLAALLPGLMVGLSACGGTAKQVRSSQTTDTGASTSTDEMADADATDGQSKKKLTDEDFLLRKIEEVKAPDYLPNVDRSAQDAFREGVKSALSSPPKYGKALLKFKEAIAKDASFMEAYFNLGMTLERKGRRDDALKVYKNALEKNPDDASASAYVAKLYLGKGRNAELLGNTKEAVQWFEKAKGLLDSLVAGNPNNEAVNNALALYYLSKDDLETAEKFVKEVLYAEPTNVTALNTRGLLYLKRKQYLIAEWIFLRKVLEQDPNSTEALTNLGATYIRLNKRPLAMKYFNKALAEDPYNMEVRMNIAALLLEHLNYAEAHTHYVKILQAQPLNLEAGEGLCDAKYGLGGSAADAKKQFTEAINCYAAFVRKRPERTDIYKVIALTYKNKFQDYDKALKFIAVYEKKAELAPEEATQISNMKKEIDMLQQMARGDLKFDDADFGDETGEPIEEMDADDDNPDEGS